MNLRILKTRRQRTPRTPNAHLHNGMRHIQRIGKISQKLDSFVTDVPFHDVHKE